MLLDGKPIQILYLFAVQADGRDVLTVEGLEHNGQCTPSRKGSGRSTGLQCGFCTPGMLMTGYALLQHNSAPTEEEIRWAISGNHAGARAMSTLSKRSSMRRRRYGRERHDGTQNITRKSAAWVTP